MCYWMHVSTINWQMSYTSSVSWHSISLTSNYEPHHFRDPLPLLAAAHHSRQPVHKQLDWETIVLNGGQVQTRDYHNEPGITN